MNNTEQNAITQDMRIAMPHVLSRSASENCLPIGTHLAEFEITGIIGEGGFGTVYLATDRSLQRTVAIKEYMPGALAARGSDKSVLVRSQRHQETFDIGLKSFINEARLLAQFDHPALIKVYRFWEENKTGYMAMRYYEGQTLKSMVKNSPHMVTEPWLRFMLKPVLEALDALYKVQILHRDVSPDNIMIQTTGEAVLLDFGAARQLIGDATQALTVILKPGYAPIEQYADDTSMKQGPWTDIYALSAVIYYSIIKKPPPTSVARMIKDPIEPLLKLAPAGYSEQFLAAIDRGLCVNPDDRPRSIEEFRELLGIPIDASKLSPPQPELPPVVMRKEPAPEPLVAVSKDPAPKLVEAIRTVPRDEPEIQKVEVRKDVADVKPPLVEPAASMIASAKPKVATTEASTTFAVKPVPVNTAASPNYDVKPVPVNIAPPASYDVKPAPVNQAAPSASDAKPAPVKPVVSPPPEKQLEAKKSKPKSNRRLILLGIVLLATIAGAAMLKFSGNNDAMVQAANPPVVAPPVVAVATPAVIPPAPPPVEVAPVLDEETIAWDILKANTEAKSSDVASFLQAYPAGKYTEEARKRLEGLKAAATVPAASTTVAATEEIRPKVTGAVKLAISPWGKVIVDGVPKGVSPPLKQISLPEGKHQIKVTNPNFPDYVTEIEVKKSSNGTIFHAFSSDTR